MAGGWENTWRNVPAVLSQHLGRYRRGGRALWLSPSNFPSHRSKGKAKIKTLKHKWQFLVRGKQGYRFSTDPWLKMPLCGDKFPLWLQLQRLNNHTFPFQSSGLKPWFCWAGCTRPTLTIRGVIHPPTHVVSLSGMSSKARGEKRSQ